MNFRRNSGRGKEYMNNVTKIWKNLSSCYNNNLWKMHQVNNYYLGLKWKLNRTKRGNLMYFITPRNTSYFRCKVLFIKKKRGYNYNRLSFLVEGMVVTKRLFVDKNITRTIKSLNLPTYTKSNGLVNKKVEWHAGFITTNIYKTKVTISKYIEYQNVIRRKIMNKEWPTAKEIFIVSDIISNVQTNIALYIKKEGKLSTSAHSMINKWSYKLFTHIITIEQFLKSKDFKILNYTNHLFGSEKEKEFKLKLIQILKNWNNERAVLIRKENTSWKEITKKTEFLCVTTISCKIVQRMFLLLYDPLIEEISDKSSFGFRCGKNYIQALTTLKEKLQLFRKDYMLIWNADIKKCSKGSYKWLVENFPAPENHLKILYRWLKLRSIEYPYVKNSKLIVNRKKALQETNISLLLINFTINGLERVCKDTLLNFNRRYKKLDAKEKGWSIFEYASYKQMQRNNNLIALKYKHFYLRSKFVRYFDNFVFICNSNKLYKKTLININKFLKARNLKPGALKTNFSFNFLGYIFYKCRSKRYVWSKTKNIKTRQPGRKKQDFISMYPSFHSFKNIKLAIKHMIHRGYNLDAYKLVKSLNRVLLCWFNYFKLSNISAIWSSLKFYLQFRLKKWAIKKTPKSRTSLFKHFKVKDFYKYYKLTYLEKLGFSNIINNVKLNVWNFYALAKKLTQYKNITYYRPKIIFLVNNHSIKKLVNASSFIFEDTVAYNNFYTTVYEVGGKEKMRSLNKALRYFLI
nr:hypothetical protein [Porphyridium purpureum]